MAELVANRYAKALFEAGLELDKLDGFKEDLNLLVKALESHEDLARILAHPKISKDEKKKILKNIFNENVNVEFLNFLYVIIDKRREGHLESISERFTELYNDHNNIEEVTCFTAIPMEEESMEKLKDKLSKSMNKTIVLKNVVDKSILGGIVLKTGNKVIDGSYKGQLGEIEKLIKNVSL